jgi:Fe-S cluster assembly iron-binding protein IscA
MLQLTTEAADLIRGLRAERGAGDALLRVSSRGASDGSDLTLGFVPAADVGDQVGESEGVPMCVASDLADELDDKVLDVTDAPDGKALIVRAA